MADIYFAARYSRHEELQGYRADLEALGHTVTSRWINGDHQTENDNHEMARQFAEDDIWDLEGGAWNISFTEPPRTSSRNRGGRHVEFGYALGVRRFVDRLGISSERGPRLIVIGPRENVFHHLPEVEVFETWEEFMEKGGVE